MDIDAQCGRHFRYRDLVECGETWIALANRERIDNRPKVTATYEWMRAICGQVLDPLMGAYGNIELTYGFASKNLTRHIARRIAPSIDQHAGEEVRRSGELICSRKGLAVDLRVGNVNAFDVAHWLVENTPFDRIYLYGSGCPIHVSIGPENARAIVLMNLLPSGRRVPRVIQAGQLRTLASTAQGPDSG